MLGKLGTGNLRLQLEYQCLTIVYQTLSHKQTISKSFLQAELTSIATSSARFSFLCLCVHFHLKSVSSIPNVKKNQIIKQYEIIRETMELWNYAFTTKIVEMPQNVSCMCVDICISA